MSSPSSLLLDTVVFAFVVALLILVFILRAAFGISVRDQEEKFESIIDKIASEGDRDGGSYG